MWIAVANSHHDSRIVEPVGKAWSNSESIKGPFKWNDLTNLPAYTGDSWPMLNRISRASFRALLTMLLIHGFHTSSSVMDKLNFSAIMFSVDQNGSPEIYSESIMKLHFFLLFQLFVNFIIFMISVPHSNWMFNN